MVRRRIWLALAAIAALALGSAAAGMYAVATGRDETMERLCSIPPILEEEAFLENRTVFYWLGTTGTSIEGLGISVPGYEPTTDAQFEEMRVERATMGGLANAAAGLGRAWAGAANGQNYRVADAPNAALRLLPDAGDAEDVLLFEVNNSSQDCRLSDWLSGEIERAGDDLGVSEEERTATDIRAELELSASEALARMRASRREGRCLQARWVPREELPLRAYRAYETRHAGMVNYWLSPHIVTKGNSIVYFSMGVVRTSALYDALGFEAPDPLERVCCVGQCSRFGGPDPYMTDIRWRRAVWRNPRQPRQQGE